MRNRPTAGQVWKHGSVHYKVVKMKADGSLEVLVRNGPTGRWSSKSQILTPSDLNYLEFVKAPPDQVTLEEPPETEIVKRRIFNRTIKKTKRYVITYAQNATPVHEEFLNSILTYCKENKAELIVIPGRYRNPTSIWTAQNQSHERWDMGTFPFNLLLSDH